MTYPNEHEEQAAWAARVRARNVSIRVKGVRKEEAEVLARHAAGMKLKLHEAALLISILILAGYSALSQMDALVAGGLV